MCNILKDRNMKKEQSQRNVISVHAWHTHKKKTHESTTHDAQPVTSVSESSLQLINSSAIIGVPVIKTSEMVTQLTVHKLRLDFLGQSIYVCKAPEWPVHWDTSPPWPLVLSVYVVVKLAIFIDAAPYWLADINRLKVEVHPPLLPTMVHRASWQYPIVITFIQV